MITIQQVQKAILPTTQIDTDTMQQALTLLTPMMDIRDVEGNLVTLTPQMLTNMTFMRWQDGDDTKWTMNVTLK